MATMMYLTLQARAAPSSTADCTIATCALSTSYWYYIPSLPANAILLGLFTLSLLGFLTTYLATHRRFTPFTLALCAGCALEILGYSGRITSHRNPWHESGFLLQICCLTIAPAFMAAALYMSLAQVVETLGPRNSRIRPAMYARLFVPCDLVSLVLQALGGGMASSAYHQGKPSALGDHVMVAGLASQVLTLGIFITLGTEFAIRTYRSPRPNEPATSSNVVRSQFRFHAFLAALAAATLCIFVRSVYRVIELSEGWQGHLIRQQWLFVGLEGVMVVIAVLVLNVAHPAFAYATDSKRQGSGPGETKEVF